MGRRNVKSVIILSRLVSSPLVELGKNLQLRKDLLIVTLAKLSISSHAKFVPSKMSEVPRGYTVNASITTSQSKVRFERGYWVKNVQRPEGEDPKKIPRSKTKDINDLKNRLRRNFIYIFAKMDIQGYQIGKFA